MSADLKRQVELIVETVGKQGWKVALSGTGHWRLCPQDKRFPVQFISYTPSDARAIKNIRAQLKKAGAKL